MLKVGYEWTDTKGKVWRIVEMLPFGKARVIANNGALVGEMRRRDIPTL